MFLIEKGVFLEADTWHTSPTSLPQNLLHHDHPHPWCLALGFLGYNIYVPYTYVSITINTYCIQQAIYRWFYMLTTTLWDGYNPQFMTEILRFIDFFKCTHLVEWKSQGPKSWFSNGRIHVLFYDHTHHRELSLLERNPGLRKNQNEDISSWHDYLTVSWNCSMSTLGTSSLGFVLIDSYNFNIGKRFEDQIAQLPRGHLAFAWMLPVFSWGSWSILCWDSTNS